MAIIEYGYALWNPVVWLVIFLVLAGVTLFFRSRGQKGYKKGTAQTQIFLAGEEMPPIEQLHIKAANIYWGFFEALKEFYASMMRPHTGIVSDYILWFVVVIAISAIILIMVG